MLHALLQYAEQNGIKGEPGFIAKHIRWLLQFSPSGEYLGLLPASDERRGREFPKVPHLQFAGDTPMRQFLVDTAQYAVLYGAGTPNAKLQRKHAYFLDRLRDASAVEPVLGRVADSLEDPARLQRIHADLDAQSPKAKPADNVTFVEVSDSGPRLILQDSSWHNWWREYRPTLFADKGQPDNLGPMRCLLSGDLVQPAAVHPKIKGLGTVGGNVETTLVGFNLDAFCSYGLKQSANAATSAQSSQTYAAALNHLIANQSRRLSGSIVSYWYTHDIPPEVDPLSILLDGAAITAAEEEEVQPPATVGDRASRQATSAAGELLASLRTGRTRNLNLGACQYRALTLSGNAGRVVVRDWMEGQFEDLAGNIGRWFEDLSITHRYGQGSAPPPKFLAVLGATVRDLKEVSPPLEASLWRAAVAGQPIPFEAASRALARARIDVIKDSPANHARMGLLKAYLIRDGVCRMTPENSEAIDHPAYVCGQIMAVLASIQNKALPNVGAGVVQRYYAAASASPALVLGRLTKLANTGHLPKIDPPKLRHWFDNQLAAAWDRLHGELPPTLSLQEQTLFAMGYYHKKAERTAAASTEAPDADENGSSTQERTQQ